MEQPLWQTDSWEAFQKALDHKALRLEGLESRPLVLIYPLFLGFQYAYIPRGPVLKPTEKEQLTPALKKLSHEQKLIFTRIDPEQEVTGLSGVPSHSIQPGTTLMLDLSLSEAELLQQMKRKGRYNIGLAEKKGVTVTFAKNEEETERYVKIFHQLLQETTQRDQFSGHGAEYYQKLLKNVPEAEIALAWYEDQPIAALIATFQKERCIYYYGASSDQMREVMAPYLLQWKTIQKAKSKGCKYYDLLGIAPENAPKDHPWSGITSFKKKFGGQVVLYPQAIDIVHRPFWYKVYKLAKIMQKLIK